MARSEKNLTAVFTDTASAIRAKTGTTEAICPLDFADKINSIQTGGTGGGGGLKEFIKAGGKVAYSDIKSFDGIINYSDTEGIAYMNFMFKGCKLLKAAPNIDTSKATNMISVYEDCIDLISVPEIDTSNVVTMDSMFSGCTSLTTIPRLNTSKVLNMDYMFYNCSHLTSVPELDTSRATKMTSMFSGCSSLTTIPLINTSNAKYMQTMFNNCRNLTSLPELNTSNATDMSYMLGGCMKLTEIPAFDCSSCTNLRAFMLYTYDVTAIHLRNIKVSLSISDPKNLTRAAIVEVLNNLATVTSTQKLTMGSTNLAKLTDEDKAIATNKGWTLA